ncbi:hypothetical protein [Halobacterium wangiae]|uniref:hypothetical protein n=1 Tax=Halobacterium wangiae TaxID=2902623 RepID=UPI001E5A58CB|nr:hypothetical protein [Halobacterium wangiae]
MNTRETESTDSPLAPPTGEQSSAPLERVQNHPLPEHVRPLVDSYETLIGDRDRFLWKWAHHLFPKFTLSTVPPEYAEHSRDAKLLGLLFVSVLDDVAEKHMEWATFDEAAKLPFEHQSTNYAREGVDRDALAFASEVWDQFSARLRDGPRSAEFADIVQFDLKQVVNAMDYSYLANQNLDAVTESEVQTYDAHNMMLFGFVDVDLAYSPEFDRADLATLRRVVDRAQRMVRIGNWVTTWEREVAEGDFTSGVVAHALEHELVSPEQLRASRADGGEHEVGAIIGTIHDHDVEDVFLRQWTEERDAAREFEGELASVDVGSYLDGIETVMEYHLMSRGLK